jgi:hypothetical protein
VQALVETLIFINLFHLISYQLHKVSIRTFSILYIRKLRHRKVKQRMQRFESKKSASQALENTVNHNVQLSLKESRCDYTLVLLPGCPTWTNPGVQWAFRNFSGMNELHELLVAGPPAFAESLFLHKCTNSEGDMG